jgi:hypothetical protein
MRMLLGALTVWLAATWTGPASAEILYPWCAYYAGQGGGGTNCGFSTWQQCQWAISGNGGYCGQNPSYSAGQPPGVPAKRYRPY